MPWFLGSNGPYLGDRVNLNDQQIPERPDHLGYDQSWTGSSWVATRRPFDPVTKLTIVNRMISSGHSNSFRAFLSANPDAADQWNAATVIYAGSEPADANTAITGQTLLVEETLGSPFAPGSSGGVLSPTLPSQVNAASTGTAAFYRVYKSDGTTCVMQDTCGTSAAGMILNTLSLTVGGPVLVTSWTITAGMA